MREHTRAKQRRGHEAEAAEQSKAREGFLRCRAAAARKHRGEHTGRWGGEHATGVRGHTHTHRHTATLGSLHNVNKVVCAQRLFPSCIWEVNTRVWAQSPGQRLQIAKGRPCFLEFGVYCFACVLKTQNQKEKKRKRKISISQKTQSESGQPTPRLLSGFGKWGREVWHYTRVSKPGTSGPQAFILSSEK